MLNTTAWEGDQFNDKLLSWWPSSENWATSGKNMGCWTAQSEDWYSRRLDALKADDPATVKLRNKPLWKKSVKFIKSYYLLSLFKSFNFILI